MFLTIEKKDLVAIGQFNRTHGVKGELSFSLQKPDLLEKADPEYIVCLMEGLPVPFYIEEYSFKSDSTGYMTLWHLDSEEKAREFVNATIYLHKPQLGEEGDEELFVEDLVGYTLWDKEVCEVGTIIQVDTTTINTLLLVDRGGEECYIPYSDDFFVSVDEKEKILRLDLPEGLISMK